MRLHFYVGFWQRKRLHFLACGVAGACRLLCFCPPKVLVFLRHGHNSLPPPPLPRGLRSPFSDIDFTYGFRRRIPDATQRACYLTAHNTYTCPDYDLSSDSDGETPTHGKERATAWHLMGACPCGVLAIGFQGRDFDPTERVRSVSRPREKVTCDRSGIRALLAGPICDMRSITAP